MLAPASAEASRDQIPERRGVALGERVMRHGGFESRLFGPRQFGPKSTEGLVLSPVANGRAVARPRLPAATFDRSRSVPLFRLATRPLRVGALGDPQS